MVTLDREPRLVNLAGLPHSDQHKRNQSIFHHLLVQPALFSAGIFVNPPWVGDRRASVYSRAQRLVQAFGRPSEVSGGARIVHPAFVLPLSTKGLVAALQSRLLSRRIEALVGHRTFWLWINNFDLHSFGLARHLAPKAKRVVVDLSDDFTTFQTKDPEGLQVRLKAALGWADGLVAVNEAVAVKFPHPRSLVFGNATDFANFQRWDPEYRLGDVLPKSPGQRIVGFVGGLHSERVDKTLLGHLLAALPGVMFVFVGYSNDPELILGLRERPNVRVYPTVPYPELSSVIHAFDVAIVPHLDNEFTRGNDLLKVRDYLACGVPVVTTRSSAVERFGAALHQAEDVSAFIASVKGLIEGTLAHDPRPGVELARQGSWSLTVPKLADWLREIDAEGR